MRTLARDSNSRTAHRLKPMLPLLACAATMYAQAPFSGGPAIDEQIGKAVSDQLIPGAVLLIGHDGKIVYKKAYGSRALIPAQEPMTVDTIFDAASLTKGIAT